MPNASVTSAGLAEPQLSEIRDSDVHLFPLREVPGLVLRLAPVRSAGPTHSANPARVWAAFDWVANEPPLREPGSRTKDLTHHPPSGGSLPRMCGPGTRLQAASSTAQRSEIRSYCFAGSLASDCSPAHASHQPAALRVQWSDCQLPRRSCSAQTLRGILVPLGFGINRHSSAQGVAYRRWDAVIAIGSSLREILEIRFSLPEAARRPTRSHDLPDRRVHGQVRIGFVLTLRGIRATSSPSGQAPPAWHLRALAH